jgi:membrane protease subunit HflK
MRVLRYALLLALVAYVLTSVKQVRLGERAVVRRFGRVAALPSPGLWIGLPYGMDRVDLVPVDRLQRVRVGYEPDADESDLTTPPGQLLTGDHNLVNVQAAVDYTVGTTDAELVDYVVQAERAEGLIARTGEAVLAGWIAERSVDDVLRRGKAELPAVLVGKIQARADSYRLGVRIRSASVAYLMPPNEVKDAFDEVNRAQTAIRTSENAARQKAESLRSQTEARRVNIEQMTSAYVKEQLELARAEAESFTIRLRRYQQLRRDNPNYLTGIWWEEIGKLFTQMKNNGRLDFLDNHLGPDGLDLSIAPGLPKKK